MKKWLSAILALALLLSVSACGGATETSTSSEAAASEAETKTEASEVAGITTETEVIDEDASDEIASNDSEEPSSIEEDIEDTSVATATVTYPLEGGPYELSIWQPLNTAFTMLISSYDELPSKPLVEEATGVQITFMEPSESTASEQFNLIIASGEYPDLFSTDTYNGGASSAYSDGVIRELSDLVAEYAPDYYAYLMESGEDALKNVLDDDGNMLFIAGISDEYTYENGLVIRQDWLDELGLEAPHTVTELTEVLTAFQTNYGCTNTFHVTSSGIMAYVYGAFGVDSFDLSGTASVDLGMYHVGDQVYSTVSSEGYREYLEYFKSLYDAKLIDQEFYSFVMSYDSMTNITVLGAAGIWDTMVDNLVSTTQQAVAETPDYHLMGIANIVREDGDVNQFAEIPLTVDASGTAISTTCQYPEIAVSFVNWFFTDDGYMVGNYGVGRWPYNGVK